MLHKPHELSNYFIIFAVTETMRDKWTMNRSYNFAKVLSELELWKFRKLRSKEDNSSSCPPSSSLSSVAKLRFCKGNDSYSRVISPASEGVKRNAVAGVQRVKRSGGDGLKKSLNETANESVTPTACSD